MDGRASEWERQRVREIAAAVLDGRTTVLEAVRELCPLAHTEAIAKEEDRTLVITIDSESISYKVRADDGNLYILRQQTSTLNRAWDLVSFRRAG
jgi:hypothetical protein